MNINDAFPSNYLKAADLQGRTITVKISHVTSEKLGDDNKLILYFDGKQKGMVLNKTNANNLAFAFGPETDDWQGAEAQLYPTMVDFQGRSVEALRIKPIPMRRSAPAQAANGGGKKFPNKGSYGRVTSGLPDDRDTEQQRQEYETSDEVPF
jgi:hypothetical protein